MRFLNWIRGIHVPRDGIPAVSAADLRIRLLALNRPTAPFEIRDCRNDDPENADLVGEWRMREPAWYAVFGQANLSHSFQVFMRLLPERNEVQSIDRRTQVNWQAGIPSFSYAKTWSRGQQWEYRGAIRPFYETTPSGERVAYRFSSSELKKPLQDAVTEAGWVWRSRFAGSLPRGSAAEAARAAHPDPRRRWMALWVCAISFVVLTNVVSGAAGLAIRLASHEISPFMHVPLWQSLLPWLVGAGVALLLARIMWRALRP